jgi:RNA methyltransferase, TrmH family
MLLSSLQNPRIKSLLDLQSRKRARSKQQRFVVEGKQEIEYALRSDFQLLEYYLPEGISIPSTIIDLKPELFHCTTACFNHISVRGLASSAVAIFAVKQKFNIPTDLNHVLLVENIEKPGNLGALFRSASASGVQCIVSTGNSTDFYHPNCIRSSVGTVFLVPHLHMPNEEALLWTKKNNLEICSTSLEGSKTIFNDPIPEKLAWVMGGEHDGISDFWKQNSDSQWRIPMHSNIDSLNVSVAAALVLFETMRQRSFNRL